MLQYFYQNVDSFCKLCTSAYRPQSAQHGSEVYLMSWGKGALLPTSQGQLFTLLNPSSSRTSPWAVDAPGVSVGKSPSLPLERLLSCEAP